MQPVRETTGDRILGFIRQFIAHYGYSPSVREMRDGCFISSTSVIYYWLLKLRTDGILKWREGQNRTVRFAGDHSPNDLVLRFTADESKLIMESCGGKDPAEMCKDTLVYLATRHRQGFPTNGHDNLFAATIAQGD